ncbi:sugar transferase [Pacificibacter marinus]|nr:sugar transferase [Pacificibacter marinus]
MTPFLIIIAAPILLISALSVRIDSPGPIFYLQERVGYRGKIFSIFKFRTRTHDTNAGNEHLLEVLKTADPSRGQYKTGMEKRITKTGKILRKTSLDELPQLFSVMLGHISLVGPRPHTVEEVSLFPKKYALRHEVPPSMTRLWQISGRNKLSPIQMLDLDLEYVTPASIGRYFHILVATIPAVL